jgi:serine phosphatase RsbU (regulator of sigma subunit)
MFKNLPVREKIKILIIDESKDDIKKISDLLISNGYLESNLITINDEESFTNVLTKETPDVIISEHEVKSYNSLNGLNISKKILPNVIFIVVSGQITDDFGLELIKEGIDIYYLKKSFSKLPFMIEKFYNSRHIEEEMSKLESINAELERAYREIEMRNKNMIQSILFAKRIQDQTLPKIDILLKNFPEAFIINKPKDIVTGDFYWFHNTAKSDVIMPDDRFMVAVGDCTGHGVSGALLSMIGYNLLNEIVSDDDEKITDPTIIMKHLDNSIVKALKQDSNVGYQDGIDMSFVSIDKINKKIYFCGCKRPLLYLVRSEKQINVFKGEQFMIGGTCEGITKTFKTIEIPYQENDIIYMLTDGITDQFGGPRNRKLMRDNFKEMLIEVHHLNLVYQAQLLEQKLLKWRGDNEQTDDILVVGIKL